MLKLPPYSPELNPAEQVWQYMRQHWLSNRCFDNYEHIINTICEAWNALIASPDKIRSITWRDRCVL